MKSLSFQTILNYILIIIVIIFFPIQVSDRGIKYKLKDITTEIYFDTYEKGEAEVIVYENWVKISIRDSSSLIIPKEKIFSLTIYE